MNHVASHRLIMTWEHEQHPTASLHGRVYLVVVKVFMMLASEQLLPYLYHFILACHIILYI